MKGFPIPTILQCIHFTDISPTMRTRDVKDYEFDLYIDGEREMYLDDKHYHLSKGSLVFRKPGQKVSSVGDYNVYIMTLDFEKINIEQPDNYVRSSYTQLQTSQESDMLDIIPEHFYPAHFEEIKALYKKIMSCSYPNKINKSLQEGYITEFLFLILADAKRYRREMLQKISLPQSHIDKVLRYINNNYAKEITIDDMAGYASLNKNYLIRLFKKELGTTPNNYLSEIRLFHAQIMLAQSQLSVKDISLSCGFNTPSYFIKCFKLKYGKTPSEYRAELQSIG